MGDPSRNGQDPSRTIRNLDDEPMPESPVPAEITQEAFQARAEKQTGMKFTDIPSGDDPGDQLYEVVAVRGQESVIAFEEGGVKKYRLVKHG